MIKYYRKIVLLVFLLGVILDLNGQTTYNPNKLPFPSYLYQDIESKVDESLQVRLDNLLSKNPKYTRLIDEKKMAIGLVDISNPENIKYASVNGKHMMYAASLPKISVLLSAMEAVKQGCIQYDYALKSDLRMMIAQSNNEATTRVIEKLGFDWIASVMQDEKYKLYDVMNGGGLWVGKKYAKEGLKNPDPLQGLSHAATVEQVCRFYTMLAYDQLVDEVYNDIMMEYLINPEINHKFVKVLQKIAPNADIYRKSGSWKSFHSDSALVFGKGGRKYILVALIEDESGGRICSNLVRIAEKALKVKNVAPPRGSKKSVASVYPEKS